jgi:hypothetical protein
MELTAQTFFTYDYAVTKELAKDFLTLVSAILVFSITFSEKIADFPRASKRTRGLLLSAWSSFITAIITCGTGLCFVTVAAGVAIYGPGWPFPSIGYLQWANWGWLLILAAGALFVVGLILLMRTAISAHADYLARQAAAADAVRPGAAGA